MKRRTRNKKVVGRIVSAVLAVVLAFGSPGLVIQAAEAGDWSETEEVVVEVLEAKCMENPIWPSDISTHTMLTECMITVGGDNEAMYIDIVTGAVGMASVLGVKDVKIYKKTWYGGWDLVATCNGAEDYNCSIFGITITYKNAIKDATYKITCVHYGTVDEYFEGENDSGAFVYSFYE